MPDLPRVFGALADDTRWQILDRLGESDASASTLARELPVSRQAIAKHLRVLAGCGLVVPRSEGREVRYAPAADRFAELGDDLHAIAAGWQRRLRRVKAEAEALADRPVHP